MHKQTIVSLILLLFSFINTSSSSQNIHEISEEFYNNKILKDTSKKWFIVFITENCSYCSHILKLLKEISEPLNKEFNVNFGVANCSYAQNFWLGLAFNLTQLPTMIYIEDGGYYLYTDFVDEKQLRKYFGFELDEKDKRDLPGKITFFSKASIAFSKVVSEIKEKLEEILKKKGYDIKINASVIVALIIFFFIILLYIESKMTSYLGYFITNLCKKKTTANELNQEKANGKEKIS